MYRALMLLIALAGCEKDATEKPAVEPVNEADMAEYRMRDFKDQMCACNDKTCGQRVNDELSAYRNAMKERQPSSDAAQVERMRLMNATYMECMMRAAMPGEV